MVIPHLVAGLVGHAQAERARQLVVLAQHLGAAQRMPLVSDVVRRALALRGGIWTSSATEGLVPAGVTGFWR